MNLVRVSGSIGLISLWISLLSYFSSLILYIISFSLPDWIVYTSKPIKVGIWRLCDIQVRLFYYIFFSFDCNNRLLVMIDVLIGVPEFIQVISQMKHLLVHPVIYSIHLNKPKNSLEIFFEILFEQVNH